MSADRAARRASRAAGSRAAARGAAGRVSSETGPHAARRRARELAALAGRASGPGRPLSGPGSLRRRRGRAADTGRSTGLRGLAARSPPRAHSRSCPQVGDKRQRVAVAKGAGAREVETRADTQVNGIYSAPTVCKRFCSQPRRRLRGHAQKRVPRRVYGSAGPVLIFFVIFERRALHFHFVLSSANYVACPSDGPLI